jgi:hypothetical protein
MRKGADVSQWRWPRHLLAAYLRDAPRYRLAIDCPRLARWLGRSWVDLCNRHERLVRRPGQRGVTCAWRWSSPLFYCQAYPPVGRRLLARAMQDWPFAFRDQPEAVGEPLVSFIIGHRGRARLPHLQAVLASIAAQTDVPIECIVVEQSGNSELAGALPAWVRHIHTPPPRPDMPYARAWAFNVGACQARGRILVCHDNDICVPVRYAAELARIFALGFEAARLQRFVFYLSETGTGRIFQGRSMDADCPPLEVVQNCEGHTLAVDRDVYFAVGGHDETFIGWGGEDNEMFDRLRARRLHDAAYLPFLHLWHPPQPDKAAVHSNTAYFEARMAVPAADRIVELKQRGFGRLDGPTNPGGPDPDPATRSSSMTHA